MPPILQFNIMTSMKAIPVLQVFKLLNPEIYWWSYLLRNLSLVSFTFPSHHLITYQLVGRSGSQLWYWFKSFTLCKPIPVLLCVDNNPFSNFTLHLLTIHRKRHNKILCTNSAQGNVSKIYIIRKWAHNWINIFMLIFFYWNW